MESTPKKATEKIGGQLRKKLPKKSVGLADCENGIEEGLRGQGAGLPGCQSGRVAADNLAVSRSVDGDFLQAVDCQAFSRLKTFYRIMYKFFSADSQRVTKILKNN